MSETPTKPCSKCRKELPATRDHFYSGKAAYGLHAYCKECFKAQEYARRRANPERTQEIAKRHIERNRDAINAKSRQKYAQRMANDPEFAEQERERSREKARKERVARPEIVRGRFAKYRAKHAELIKDRNRKLKAREYTENPDKFKARTAKQRAERAQVPGSFTSKDINSKFKEQKGCCFYCGIKIVWRQTPWEIDHFIPISRGGNNNPDNLVIACRTCNRSKHDKFPWDWMPQRFLPNQNAVSRNSQ